MPRCRVRLANGGKADTAYPNVGRGLALWAHRLMVVWVMSGTFIAGILGGLYRWVAGVRQVIEEEGERHT